MVHFVGAHYYSDDGRGEGSCCVHFEGDMLMDIHVALLVPLHDVAPAWKVLCDGNNEQQGVGDEREANVAKNYNACIPLAAWAVSLVPGLIYTMVVDVERYEAHKWYPGLHTTSVLAFWRT